MRAARSQHKTSSARAHTEGWCGDTELPHYPHRELCWERELPLRSSDVRERRAAGSSVFSRAHPWLSPGPPRADGAVRPWGHSTHNARCLCSYTTADTNGPLSAERCQIEPWEGGTAAWD